MKTAVLGLGLLGAEIALRLQGQGEAVTGWNRTAAKADAARARGLNVAPSVPEALGDAELVLLVLGDASAIEATLFRPDIPPLLSGRVVVQMGTIAPQESRDIARRVEEAGGQYLEAPVLGSLPEAREGRLIVMAGGDPALFGRCVPVLKQLSPDPRLIGAVGQAAALKLAMNQLIAGLTASFALSLGLVRAEGIEVEQFMTLLRGSALYAPTFDKKLGNYIGHDYGAANFPLKHLLKDVRLFRDVAERAGLDTGALAGIEAACVRAGAMGLADQDYSAVYEALTST